MKKSVSVFLALLLLLGCMSVAAAAEPVKPDTKGPVPMVSVSGDGNDLYDENGNVAPKFLDIIEDTFTGKREAGDSDNLKESVANVLTPFVIGILTDNYDAYYEKLEQEITELADTIRMDENGDPRYGTHISSGQVAQNQKQMTTPNRKDTYEQNAYRFWYDWRRDPMEVADELDKYIDAVCEMTGHAQIGLSGRCLGSNFVLAYLAKYGYKNKLCGLTINAGMQYGEDPVSEAISGKFKTDGDSVNRFIADMEFINDTEFSPVLKEVVDFLEHAQILNAVSTVTKKTIYDKVLGGVTSALALSTMFTMPAYWSCVSNSDYDAAMLNVFGPQGSEKRTQYAGLIEKIERYHNNVGLHVADLLQAFQANGGNVGIMSKYGIQMIPMCESRNLVSDNLVSVKNSSMGATTSMVYNTLSKDYIAQREAEGKGKYISPDKQVDASTCLFPDNTWFIKGAEHANWTDPENAIMYQVAIADHQLTVDDFTYTQFMVYSYETKTASPMTADNANTEHWTADDPTVGNPHVRGVLKFLTSFIRILRRVIDLIQSKLG